MSSLEARIKALEAARTKKAERAAGVMLNPIIRSARVTYMCTQADAGSTHPRHLRVAELLDRARQRALVADLA